jgi:hypothetical protein
LMVWREVTPPTPQGSNLGFDALRLWCLIKAEYSFSGWQRSLVGSERFVISRPIEFISQT